MTSKSQRLADPDLDLDLAERAEDRPEPILANPPPPVPLADSASANIVFFEIPLAFAYGHGVGSVTLTSRRQLVDGSGRVFEDMIVTGLLRGSLQSLVHLKQVITEIEKLAEKAAANALAAIDTAASRPH